MSYKSKIVKIEIEQAFKFEKRLTKDKISYTQFISEVIRLYLDNQLTCNGKRIEINNDYKDKKEVEIISLISENIKDILRENNINFSCSKVSEVDKELLLKEFLNDINIKDKDTDKSYLKALYTSKSDSKLAPFIKDYFQKNQLKNPEVKQYAKYFFSKKDKRYFRLTELKDLVSLFDDFKEIETIFDEHLNQSQDEG